MGATEVARQAEVSFSRTAFARLTSALGSELGEQQATRLLRKLGFEAGMEYAAELTASRDDFDALPLSEFWSALSDFLARKGWGTLDYEPIHDGVGTLTCADGATEGMSSSFLSGIVSGLLSGVSGGAVAVLEVGRRTGTDGERCVFAFGSEQTIERLFERMRAGESFEEATTRSDGGR